MRTILNLMSALITILVVASTIGPAAAAPVPPPVDGLDTSFGSAGIAVSGRMPGLSLFAQPAIGPRGQIAVASHLFGTKPSRTRPNVWVSLFDRNGKVVGRFGRAGLAAVRLGLFVQTLDVTIDHRGRVLLLMAAARGARDDDSLMLTRLGRDGSIDRTFNHGRPRTIHRWMGTMSQYKTRVAGNGRIFVFGGVTDFPSEMVALSDRGSLVRSYGKNGRALVPFSSAQADAIFSALGADGSVFLSVTEHYGQYQFPGSSSQSSRSRPAIYKLSPDGRPDKRFDRDGRLVIKTPEPFGGLVNLGISDAGRITALIQAQVPTHIDDQSSELDTYDRRVFVRRFDRFGHPLRQGESPRTVDEIELARPIKPLFRIDHDRTAFAADGSLFRATPDHPSHTCEYMRMSRSGASTGIVQTSPFSDYIYDDMNCLAEPSGRSLLVTGNFESRVVISRVLID